MDKKRRNTIISTAIGIAALFVAVTGISYAFFQPQEDDLVLRDVRITTETADSTGFFIDRPLSLRITQSNFGEGSGDRVGDVSTAVAMFTASGSDEVEVCYTLRANVTTNEFDYTSNLNGTPTMHYVASVGSDTTTYYDDIDSNATTETAFITYLRNNNYVTESGGVDYIKETPDSANTVTLTAFYGDAQSKTSVFVSAGYLESKNVYPKSTDAELVLNVTRQTALNANSPVGFTYDSTVTNLITDLDVTTLTGVIYIPDSATLTTVVNSLDKGDLGTFAYYDDANGPKNIHKLVADPTKTTAHKYSIWITAKNKDYSQEEITGKHFSGSLIFELVSCDTPANAEP